MKKCVKILLNIEKGPTDNCVTKSIKSHHNKPSFGKSSPDSIFTKAVGDVQVKHVQNLNAVCSS